MKAVILCRVSTREQGKSGLGLQAQLSSCESFCGTNDMQVVATYNEVVSGGASLADRPILQEAMNTAKVHNAVLVVAKLDRLSRSVHFVSSLMVAGVAFKVAELGFNVDNFQLHLFAALAEHERKLIKSRCLAAQKKLKEAGVPLGTHNPKVMAGRARASKATNDRLFPHIKDAMELGYESLRELAMYLNGLGVKTPRGKAFTKANLSPIMKRYRAQLELKF